jgi:hypothetical protein
LIRRHFVDGLEAVEGARIADEGEELRQHVDKPRAIVADSEVRGDMTFDLRLAAA